MITKFKKIFQHPFVRNVATLQIGSFGASLVQGLVGIIIARLLQPQLYGVYSLAFGLASLLVLIVSMGLSDAVTTIVGESYAREDTKATHGAFMFSARMMIIIGALSLGAIIYAPKISLYFYNNPQIGWYASILVIAGFISSTFFNFSSLALQVTGNIKKMSLLGLADQVVRSGLSLLFVFLGFGILGSVTGHLIGTIIIFFISVIIWRTIKRNHSIFPSLRDFANKIWDAELKKYFKFSAWIALDKNIAALYGILPILMIGLYVSAADISYFKISFAYINLALSLLGPISVLLNVEFPKLKVTEIKQLRNTFLRVSLYSLGLSMLLTGGAIVVSPIALRILYGQSFLPGLKYVFGLFIYGGFLGIGVALGPMWRAINKVKISIIINAVTLGVGIPTGLYLIRHFGIWGGILMISAWFTISHLISFFYLLVHLKNRINRVL
ncbi:oligosaccharide flippase family protein [Candidatus Parcubacteria bacterium]|nr:oligosaccharide flippase family protein [Candidatus Parcubacteria bacterium]